MTLVVDASVAIKWVVPEDGRSEALRLTAGQELIAPEFALTEAANIIWKKVRLGQVERAQAGRALEFIGSAYVRLIPTRQSIDAALSLALEHDHPVYDCLYLAAARAEGIDLLTADARLARVATASHTPVILLQGQAS